MILGNLKIKNWILLIVCLLCSIQSLKSIDLRGYIETVSASLSNGLTPPYPIENASNGDFFQSPVAVLFLMGLSYFPLPIIKLLAFFYTSLGLFYVFKKLRVSELSSVSFWAVVLLFSHSLSDLFLSMNFLFPSFVLWFLGLEFKNSKIAGVLIALAVFLRPPTILLSPFLFFSEETRRTLPYAVLAGAVFLASTFLAFPNPLSWWERWFQALPLYSQAAEILSPSFQSPPAVIQKISLQVFEASRDRASLLSHFFGGLYYLLCLIFAFVLRKRKQGELAFSILLSTLYCSMGRIWVGGFISCLPFLVRTLHKNESTGILLAGVIYTLSQKWIWPLEIWNHLMIDWGAQGLILMSVLLWCWKRTQSDLQSLDGTS
jgi:hypothetical protein